MFVSIIFSIVYYNSDKGILSFKHRVLNFKKLDRVDKLIVAKSANDQDSL